MLGFMTPLVRPREYLEACWDPIVNMTIGRWTKRSICARQEVNVRTITRRLSQHWPGRCFRQPSRCLTTAATAVSKVSTPAEMLAKPTWSVHSLLPLSAEQLRDETTATPTQVRRLLRLSALPPPSSAEDEDALLNTLQEQLRFVRNVQKVDTTGVEPLRAIRDETAAAKAEATVNVEQLRSVLSNEVLIGHKKRPRRRKMSIDHVPEQHPNLAPRSAIGSSGPYFTVRSSDFGTP
jgi:Asp-tRNA(Asn)/Glu-tRNA(Gln) amidotransferase C subunit